MAGDEIERLTRMEALHQDNSRALVGVNLKVEESLNILRGVATAVAGSQLSLKDISNDTNSMASTLKEMHADNRKIIDVIGGKKQVPLMIFVIVISVLAVSMILERVQSTGARLAIGRDSLNVTPEPRAAQK